MEMIFPQLNSCPGETFIGRGWTIQEQVLCAELSSPAAWAVLGLDRVVLQRQLKRPHVEAEKGQPWGNAILVFK